MGIKVFDLDIHNLPLADFMRAMGYEPTARDGNRLTYDSPYSSNGSIVVDTEKNGWYDKQEPEKCYGGIYDLAYEITGSCNRSELNLFIAVEMKKIMDFKCYEVLGNGESANADMILAMPVKNKDGKRADTAEGGNPEAEARTQNALLAYGYRRNQRNVPCGFPAPPRLQSDGTRQQGSVVLFPIPQRKKTIIPRQSAKKCVVRFWHRRGW